MADRQTWEDSVEPTLRERRANRHAHIYYNRGGSYRGYEDGISGDCNGLHPTAGATYRCNMVTLLEAAARESRPTSYETGSSLRAQ